MGNPQEILEGRQVVWLPSNEWMGSRCEDDRRPAPAQNHFHISGVELPVCAGCQFLGGMLLSSAWLRKFWR